MVNTTDVVFIRGKRIILRPLFKRDIPQLLQWINDTEITQYLMAYLPITEDQEEKWLEGLPARLDTDIIFAITTLDGKLIGNMGLHGINWKDRTASTGALIGDKDYWGKVYGTEAKMLILNYAFNTLNLRKINSSVLAFNERSHAYLKKCGYTEEGRRKNQFFARGEYVDEILMAVFKHDWEPIWQEYKKEHLS